MRCIRTLVESDGSREELSASIGSIHYNSHRTAEHNAGNGMGRSRSQCCGIQALDISNTIRTCIVSMIVRMVCTSCCISCTARTLACAANLHRFKTKQWTSAREHGGRSEGGWDAATPFPQSSVELLQLSRSTAQQLPRSLLRCSYAGLCSCDQETEGESAQLYRAQSGLPKPCCCGMAAVGGGDGCGRACRSSRADRKARARVSS